MKFHFLIDYENVKDDGLAGIFDLDENDTVSIFYTENAMRMGFSFVERFINGDCKAKIKFISGETGEQALDKQICFYLGWLVHSGDDTAYIIISGDRGYDNVIDLARKTVTNEVRRFPKIKTCNQYFENGEKMAKAEEALKPAEPIVAEPEKAEQAEETASVTAEAVTEVEVTEAAGQTEAPAVEEKQEKSEKPAKKPAKKQSKKAESKKPEADPKGEFCEAIENALKKKGGYDSETVGKVAEICGSYFLKQNRKNRILNRLKNDFGNSEGKMIYDAIKSSIPKQPNEKADEENPVKAEPEKAEAKKKPAKKADSAKAEKGKKETVLNNAVTQTMNKVKVDDVLLTDEEKKAAVAIINSHKKDEPNKILTNVRNALVKEFRQVKGNTIYKAVKEHIEAFRKEQ